MTGQRGRLEKLMPDKTGLSDVMVSFSHPLPRGTRGRTSISGANTRPSRCGRSRLIGQEQSWSSVWGEPARAGRALLGAEGPSRSPGPVSALRVTIALADLRRPLANIPR